MTAENRDVIRFTQYTISSRCTVTMLCLRESVYVTICCVVVQISLFELLQQRSVRRSQHIMDLVDLVQLVTSGE